MLENRGQRTLPQHPHYYSAHIMTTSSFYTLPHIFSSVDRLILLIGQNAITKAINKTLGRVVEKIWFKKF